jgi:glycine/D-amino acid oxidase-like deaminating enzyme
LIGNLTSELPIKPARGQILVTSPIPDLPFRGTFHSDKGFKYFRNIGNMVLIGGARNIDFENETTTSTDTTSKIQNELERWLQEHVLRDRKYIFLDRWSRIMSFNDEKKPTVYSLSPKVKVVHCCNGIGVASIPPFTHKIAKEFAGL